MPKNQTSRIDDLLASVTPDMVATGAALVKEEGLRVERILLDLLRPDPVQPRRVLPERIHWEFHHQRLTPSQALRELVQIVQVAARQKGRPFHNVLELLPNSESESEDDAAVVLSPEETLLRDLVNLAVTIRDDGQVNPLTVVDISQGVTRLYRIETGERRYWATWLLRDFIHGLSGDGMIPCIVIPEQKSSVFRQAKENTARTGLTAIAMARQAALLLLTVHGYEIPAYPVGNDYYRQALNLDLRGKREYTDAILSAMGGVDRSRFAQFKALLHLSDEAMELSDRHGVDERKLRHVITLPPEHHAEVLRQIIDFNLNANQVKELCEGTFTEDVAEADTAIPASALKIARFIHSTKTAFPQDIARALLNQEGNAALARARLQVMRNLLTEAEQYLSENEKGLPG